MFSGCLSPFLWIKGEEFSISVNIINNKPIPASYCPRVSVGGTLHFVSIRNKIQPIFNNNNNTNNNDNNVVHQTIDIWDAVMWSWKAFCQTIPSVHRWPPRSSAPVRVHLCRQGFEAQGGRVWKSAAALRSFAHWSSWQCATWPT